MGIKKVGIKKAVKIGMAIEEKTLRQLAKETERDISTLSGMLSRGKPSLQSTLGVLNSVNAKLIVEYSNGQQVELEI